MKIDLLSGYVIGPFRAPTTWGVAENVRNAERLGLELVRLGVFPVIPHANTQHFEGLASDAFWLDGTLKLMLQQDFAITVEAIDLPWKHSFGSKREVAEANVEGLPLFHNLSDLRAWLETKR